MPVIFHSFGDYTQLYINIKKSNTSYQKVGYEKCRGTNQIKITKPQ